MKVYREFILKNGQTLILRSVEESDAQAELDMYIKKIGETPFLSRGLDDILPTVEDFRAGTKSYLEDEKSFEVIAILNGKVVGSGHLDWYSGKKRVSHIASVDLGVLKDYWGLGVGGKIMQTLLEEAQKSGIEKVGLTVYRKNERAIKMYESFGFFVTGIDPLGVKYSDGTYDDDLYMTKFFKEEDKLRNIYQINYKLENEKEC